MKIKSNVAFETASDFLFLAYYFDESDGVGSFRSKALYQFLTKNGFNPFCISRDTFRKKKQQSLFKWIISVLILIITGNYRIIYFSCGPFSPLLAITLACCLKKFDIIIDFRDPWSLNIHSWKSSYHPTAYKIKLWVSERIERIAYKICKYFVVCTPGMLFEYSNLFQDNSKLKLITNGYSFSPYDITRSYDYSKKDGIQIVCLGKFAEYGNESAVIRALTIIKKYVLKNGETSVHIHFIGSTEQLNSQIVGSLGLEKQSSFYPRMPYHEALKFAAGADMGLCLVRNERYDFSTKIFDYIGLGLPVMDCFDHSSEFYQYFSKVICSIEKYEPSIRNDILKIRAEFSRESAFLNFLCLLEKI